MRLASQSKSHAKSSSNVEPPNGFLTIHLKDFVFQAESIPSRNGKLSERNAVWFRGATELQESVLTAIPVDALTPDLSEYD